MSKSMGGGSEDQGNYSVYFAVNYFEVVHGKVHGLVILGEVVLYPCPHFADRCCWTKGVCLLPNRRLPGIGRAL